MIRWVLQNIVWFIIRLVVTAACLFTVKNVAHTNGYYISYDVLVVNAVCIIVAIRMWMPLCKEKQINKDTTWGG